MAGKRLLELGSRHPGHDRDNDGSLVDIAIEDLGNGVPALRLDGQDDGFRGVPGFGQRIELRAIGGIGLRFFTRLQIEDHHIGRRDMALNAKTLEDRGAERPGAH